MKKLWHKANETPQETGYAGILVEYVYGAYMSSKPRHMKFVSYTEDYEMVLDKRDYRDAIIYGEIKEGQGGFYSYNFRWDCNDIFNDNIIRWCYRKDLEEME